MKLLVCIAAHYAPERMQYLDKVLSELKTYECEVDVMIDTNSPEFECKHYDLNITGMVHDSLQHPFHLTMQHRDHFKRNIDNYDWFMYLEDDMLLPWENFLSYTEKFNRIWNAGYVPSFIRIEEKDNEQYISDVTEKYKIRDFIWIGEKPYIALPFPQHYHAFWIAPRYVIQQNLNDDFTKLHDSREQAASYLMWELKRKGLLEVENQNGKFQIAENCYSWHLPNNYIDSGMKNAKIKVKEVFI